MTKMTRRVLSKKNLGTLVKTLETAEGVIVMHRRKKAKESFRGHWAVSGFVFYSLNLRAIELLVMDASGPLGSLRLGMDEGMDRWS